MRAIHGSPDAVDDHVRAALREGPLELPQIVRLVMASLDLEMGGPVHAAVGRLHRSGSIVVAGHGNGWALIGLRSAP